jgi:hypothetical protein
MPRPPPHARKRQELRGGGRLSEQKEGQREKLGSLPFVIGGLSFIPLVGVLFGVVAIAWGLASRKPGGRKLALIGGGGIAFSVVLYGALYYFGFIERGGVYDKLRVKLAQSTLITLVQAIETYKVQHGSYPEDLGVLRQSLPQEAMVFIIDPSDVDPKDGQRYFYYERIDGEHYYARSTGPDGEPFTPDDIVPVMGKDGPGKLGLLIEPPGASGTPQP